MAKEKRLAEISEKKVEQKENLMDELINQLRDGALAVQRSSKYSKKKKSKRKRTNIVNSSTQNLSIPVAIPEFEGSESGSASSTQFKETLLEND